MRKSTGYLYAMKTMNRKRVKMKRAADLCWNERVILGRLNSPFIVCLKYAFVSKQELFLVMDLMLGGDLSFWLSKKKRFSCDETLYHAGRIYLAIRHMHKHNIVYRDLKVTVCSKTKDADACAQDEAVFFIFCANRYDYFLFFIISLSFFFFFYSYSQLSLKTFSWTRRAKQS
jgi:serine/threonine protein kinase